MDKTSIGDRMKGYEHTSRSFLQRRTPVIVRVDGKAFHTWTKRLKDVDGSLTTGPYSREMHKTMMSTAHTMMQLMQNATLAYTQSDEISILLNDWKTLKTDQWFGSNVQKIASVSASIAATAFNLFYDGEAQNIYDLAQFDARVFNLPKEEVTNYFVWRQQDATRNSINMLGQFHFSHKALHGKNVSQVQDMLMLEKGVNWNAQPTWAKRGSCVIPNPDSFDSSAAFVPDEVIPIFTKDRGYVERHLLDKFDDFMEKQIDDYDKVVKKGGPIDADKYKR
jgi:tRNA(His) 5'-end guanylyltransferase